MRRRLRPSPPIPPVPDSSSESSEPIDRGPEAAFEADRLDVGEQRPEAGLVGLGVPYVTRSRVWCCRAIGAPRMRSSTSRSSRSETRDPKARFTGFGSITVRITLSVRTETTLPTKVKSRV